MTAVGEVVSNDPQTGQCGLTVLLHLCLVIAIGPLLSENHILRPDVRIMILIALTTMTTGVLPGANPRARVAAITDETLALFLILGNLIGLIPLLSHVIFQGKIHLLQCQSFRQLTVRIPLAGQLLNRIMLAGLTLLLWILQNDKFLPPGHHLVPLSLLLRFQLERVPRLQKRLVSFNQLRLWLRPPPSVLLMEALGKKKTQFPN